MTSIVWRWLVASSLLVASAAAATRPHYGGTLRVAMQAAPVSLDPASPGGAAPANVSSLVFEKLVRWGTGGNLEPALATSWESDPARQRWQLRLRTGVRFHDGSPLTSDVVAASLRLANPNWRVIALGDAVIIECDSPNPYLPAELARARNAIVKRDGKLAGTGPFGISEWQPGKRLLLTAQDEYWGGRPFVDTIQVDMARNTRDQKLALDLGRVDVIEMAPEQVQRAKAEGRKIVSSRPAELIALVFAHDPQSPEQKRLRQALALSVDRQSIKSVLLQGVGGPAGGLLPNWMTGYGFLFSTEAGLARAQQARAEVPRAPLWTIGYDAADPMARLIAERVNLNARDAGMRLQVTTAPAADLRVVRVPLDSLEPHVALASAAAGLGITSPRLAGASVEDLYSAESALLQSQRVIPLLHLPVAYGVSGRVNDFALDGAGRWRLADCWVDVEKQ